MPIFHQNGDPVGNSTHTTLIDNQKSQQLKVSYWDSAHFSTKTQYKLKANANLSPGW